MRSRLTLCAPRQEFCDGINCNVRVYFRTFSLCAAEIVNTITNIKALLSSHVRTLFSSSFFSQAGQLSSYVPRGLNMPTSSLRSRCDQLVKLVFIIVYQPATSFEGFPGGHDVLIQFALTKTWKPLIRFSLKFSSLYRYAYLPVTRPRRSTTLCKNWGVVLDSLFRTNQEQFP